MQIHLLHWIFMTPYCSTEFANLLMKFYVVHRFQHADILTLNMASAELHALCPSH